jgi:pimeloyl-ACP methyl ester carboxylesterase
MPQTKRILLKAAVILFLQLASCATVTRIPEELPLLPLSTPTANFGEAGSIAVSVEKGEWISEYGCTLLYEIYRPSRVKTRAMVILAHGFMRDLASMRGWAAHWASYGVPVAVMSLCNSRWFNGHHDRNAADLLALARVLHNGPLLYAGFSAGGLAAYLAAARDPHALAYLGLDSVDSGGLALCAAGQFMAPALFLLAEPSSCNADGNILETIAVTRNCTALRVRHATHCYFEYPNDPRCDRICGSIRPRETSVILMDTIRILATAWVIAQTQEYPLAQTVLETAASCRAQWKGRIEVLR